LPGHDAIVVFEDGNLSNIAVRKRRSRGARRNTGPEPGSLGLPVEEYGFRGSFGVSAAGSKVVARRCRSNQAGKRKKTGAPVTHELTILARRDIRPAVLETLVIESVELPSAN